MIRHGRFFFYFFKILILVPRPFFFFFCKKDESNAVKFPPLFFPLKSSLHLLNEFNLPPWIYFYFYLLFFYSFDFFFFCIITVAVKTSGLMRKFRYVGKRNFFFVDLAGISIKDVDYTWMTQQSERSSLPIEKNVDCIFFFFCPWFFLRDE